MLSPEREHARARPPVAFWLVASGTLAVAVSRGVHLTAPEPIGAPWWPLAAAGGVAIAIGGLARRLDDAAGVLTVGAGILALAVGAAPALASRPALALVLALAAIAIGAGSWPRTGPGVVDAGAVKRRDVRIVTLLAALAGLAGASFADPWVAAGAAATALVASLRVGAWLGGLVASPALTAWALGALMATAAAGWRVVAPEAGPGIWPAALWPLVTLAVARARGVELADTSWAQLIIYSPARLLITTFLLLCVVGTGLVALPVCAASGESVGLLDAAFTAVSAVCVTGLIVLDTPIAFSLTGEIVLLVLIQLGALGIMTLSTAAFRLLGQRLSVRHEQAVAGLMGTEQRSEIYRALRRTLSLTFAIEACGAAVLSLQFWSGGDALPTAIWRGIFTAVSAFCNAGFALQSSSLIPYQHDALLLHSVAILIIAGGLSPLVLAALPALARAARARPPSLQVRTVLLASAALLVLGFAVTLSLEWDHSLAHLGLADKLHNAWFQSVTLRTAGFNAIDLTEMQPASLPLWCALMFVGGAPGGTAGGIKVTTLAVLTLAMIGSVRGSSDAVAFRRRITHATVYRAIAITATGIAVTLLATTLLLLTQDIAPDVALFEIVSAVGTVGLSIGGTAQLDEVGKIIVMITMFLGRVGPLSGFLFLTDRHAPPHRGHIEANMEVG